MLALVGWWVECLTSLENVRSLRNQSPGRTGFYWRFKMAQRVNQRVECMKLTSFAVEQTEHCLVFAGLQRMKVVFSLNIYVVLKMLSFAEEKIVLGEPPFDDVHALTGSLKLYFRELPEPLIPYDFFSGFVEAISELQTFPLVILCHII